MNESDIINGLFELIGAAFTWLSIKDLWEKKHVAGVSYWTLAFFTSWGLWNVFFYPHNGLMWSFVGGIVLCITNLIWTAMIIYYVKNPKQ